MDTTTRFSGGGGMFGGSPNFSGILQPKHVLTLGWQYSSDVTMYCPGFGDGRGMKISSLTGLVGGEGTVGVQGPDIDPLDDGIYTGCNTFE
jgi:hypothetical protein